MNNNQQISTQNHKILWLQVWGLAIVQTAFSLSWLVYRLYLPQLLAGFGLKGLDKLILIVEDGLNTIVEPLAGTFSDRTKKFTGTRLPIITIGIILSSVFFIAIPAFFILGKSIALQWVFVGILILWAIAMAMFRAPVMSLLGQYSQPKELPQAATLIVFAGLFINAIRPISTKFILGLGEGVAFFLVQWFY